MNIENGSATSKDSNGKWNEFSYQYKFLHYYRSEVKKESFPHKWRTFIESKDDRDPYIYEWTGNHWAKTSFEDLIEVADKYLEKNDKKNYSRRSAENCIYTLKTNLDKFKIYNIDDSQETIIPLKNVWLHIRQQGNNVFFDIKQPNQELPIKYVLNTTIKIDPEQTQYKPKDNTKNSKFGKYIVETLPDEEIRTVVQEYLGYTFLNHCRYEKALIMEGEGSNGKSVLINLIKALHKHTANIPLSILGDNGSLGEITQASLLYSSEFPKKVIEELLKQIISGEGIAQKLMGKNVITVQTTAKLIAACNAFPLLGDKSMGVYRRLIIVPFENVVNQGDPNYNPNLAHEIITEELDIFLDWCLIGLERLIKRNGFKIPQKLQEVTKDKMAQNNNVRQFFMDTDYIICEEKDKYPTLKDALYTEYSQWCIDNGNRALNSANFYLEVSRIYGNIIKFSREQVKKVRKTYCNLIKQHNQNFIDEEMSKTDDPFQSK